jgi:hypothetical protein
VLLRHLGPEAKVELIRLLWEMVYADGEAHELEDNVVWRVAELIGVDSRDRILMRQKVREGRGLPPRERTPRDADRCQGAGSGRRSWSCCIRRPPAPAGSGNIWSSAASISTSAGRRWAIHCPRRWPPCRRGVFGGPMSANDPDEFVKRETDWLAVPLKEDKPYLGICLGAQMLVNHLGGKVFGRDDGLVEIGWYPIEATPEGEAVMDWPDMVYHFHREGFDLPSGATLLATGRHLSQPGLPLWRQCLGHPVPCRTDAGDDAALGGAWRAPLRAAQCAGRARASERPHDLGCAAESLAARLPRHDLPAGSLRMEKADKEKGRS